VGALATRATDGPLLTRADVKPAQAGFEVQAVLNPAAARLPNGDVVLLLRIAERPRSDVDPPSDALTLDLSGPHPKLAPLPGGHTKDDVVAIAVRDPTATTFRYLPIYLPKDLPGLDTRDPRSVTFTHPTLGRTTTFLTQISHLRCARSADGTRFEVDPEPSIAPTADLEEFGCEDARAACIDGLWHVTYTSVSRVGITSSLATTPDFVTYEKHGAVLPPDQKDVALFPEKRDGRFMALTRPMPSSFGHVLGIWIAMPDASLPWGAHKPLVLPREGKWDEGHTGAGTVPFATDAGWLEIYHGANAHLDYALGAVLLDRDDPTKVIARSDEPILRPERPYETAGLFPDVVFTCGHVPLDDDGTRIRVYYGAADSCVAAADFEVAEILDSLRGPDARFGHDPRGVA
jgi:beta-1,2-mannobiose phosphorylase / 1,2-beta-oligomannan phosphorylase